MKKSVVWRAAVLFLFFEIVFSFGQSVSEEAKRHLVRGLTAVKMAASQEDFEKAIQDAILEFEQAARLAPDWPAAWYNLGLVQDKAGQFKEAIESLNRFLQLAPNDPDAGKVKESIYKIEYKAENVLAIPDIISVLASFGHADKGWESVKGDCPNFKQFAFITAEGNELIKVLDYGKALGFPDQKISLRLLKVDGPVLKYISIIDNYLYENHGKTIENEIKVVSRTHVIVWQTWAESGETFSCEYEKIRS